MTEKFNSFYTEDKYVDAHPFMCCIDNKMQLELIKLNKLMGKIDQKNYQVFEEPNIDLINQTEDFQSKNLDSSNLFDDLNFDSDFGDLMDIGKSIIDQSLEFTNDSIFSQFQEQKHFAELQPVKDEVFETCDNLYQDVELLGTYSKTDSNSSIRIEKMQNKHDNPSAQEIKLSSLKLIDNKKDLVSVMNTISQQPDDKVNNIKTPSKPALLPWEMKSKNKLPKTRIEMNQLQKPKKTDIIPRVESKANSNLKQLGSTLKKNILDNASLLSNLKASNTSTGGYKELVLNVLKKKTSI